jgi:hypothetical protein
MKLSSFLFEESNEEIIANVLLGKAISTDPEDSKLEIQKNDLKNLEVDISDLLEGKKPLKKLFFENLLTKTNVYELQKFEKGFFRIKPKDEIKKELIEGNLSKEEFVALLDNAKKALFDGLSVVEIPKGSAGSGSGTFTTYVVKDTNLDSKFYNLSISIVIAAGSNEGHDFEAQFENEIKTAKGENWEALVCFLLQEGLITSIKDIVGYEFVTKSTKVRRPFTSNISNIGSLVRDLTLFRWDGVPIYVSLKGERGATFANLGCAGSFAIEKAEDAIKVTVTEKNTPFFIFIKTLGVDLEKIRMGFEAYGNGLLDNNKQYPLSEEKKEIDSSFGSAAMDYLAAQLGYGYIYFRKTSSGAFRIFNIDTENAARDIVGNFISGYIKYPYFVDKNNKSKQCTIVVQTSTTEYKIEIRSSKGRDTAYDFLNSLECKVLVSKILSAKKDFHCKENFSLRDYSDTSLEVNMDLKTESIKLSKYLF